MKRLFWLFAVLMTVSKLWAQTTHKEIKVPMRDGSYRISTVSTNNKGQYSPLVLFIGGIGCYTISPYSEGPASYSLVMKGLNQMGIATATVEKNGRGGSQGGACEKMDFVSELENYLTAVEEIQKTLGVDKSEMTVVGHSMGGVFAPIVSNRTGIKKAVVLGTLGQKWLDYSLENVDRQLRLAGYSESQINQYVAVEKEVLDLLLVQKKTPEQIKAINPDYAAHLQLPMDFRFMQQLNDLDILKEWNQFDGAVLVVRQKSDFLTSLRDHQRIVESAKDGLLWEAEGVDHFFQKANSEKESFTSMSQGPLPLNHQFIAQLILKIRDL